VLRVKSVCKEVKRKVERLGNNIRIATSTQTIIKLQREIDRLTTRKGGSNGHQNYNRK